MFCCLIGIDDQKKSTGVCDLNGLIMYGGSLHRYSHETRVFDSVLPCGCRAGEVWTWRGPVKLMRSVWAAGGCEFEVGVAVNVLKMLLRVKHT